MEPRLKDSNIKKSAFSLLEASIVILIISILIAAVASGYQIISSAKIASARQQTQNSPVQNMDSVKIWLDATAKRGLKDREASDNEVRANSGVSIWYDQNPNSDLRHDAVSPSVLNNPKYYKKCIKSLPCLKFNGTNYMAINNISDLENNDYSIFIIEQRQSNNVNNPIIGKSTSFSSNNSIEIYYYNNRIRISQGENSSNYYEFNANPTINNFNIAKPRLHSIINKSNYLTHYLNKNLSSTANSAIFSQINNLNNIIIGANNDGSNINYYVGDIGEIIFFNKALTNVERKSVEYYLLEKWNID